jgi:hypothetical protein
MRNVTTTMGCSSSTNVMKLPGNKVKYVLGILEVKLLMPLDRRLGRPQSQSGRGGEEKNS